MINYSINSNNLNIKIHLKLKMIKSFISDDLVLDKINHLYRNRLLYKRFHSNRSFRALNLKSSIFYNSKYHYSDN